MLTMHKSSSLKAKSITIESTDTSRCEVGLLMEKVCAMSNLMKAAIHMSSGSVKVGRRVSYILLPVAPGMVEPCGSVSEHAVWTVPIHGSWIRRMSAVHIWRRI